MGRFAISNNRYINYSMEANPQWHWNLKDIRYKSRSQVLKQWFEQKHSLQIDVRSVKTLIWGKTFNPNRGCKCEDIDLGWDTGAKSRSQVCKHGFGLRHQISKCANIGFSWGTQIEVKSVKTLIWRCHSLQSEVTRVKTLIWTFDPNWRRRSYRCENIDLGWDIQAKSRFQVWKHWF